MADMGTTVGMIQAFGSAIKSALNGKLTAPETAGTSGQVLVSDGEGGQVWGDIEAGEVVIDSSLSVSGAAAEAKTTGAVKTAVNNTVTFSDLTWAVASLQTKQGYLIAARHRIVSPFIKVNGGEVITLTGNVNCLIVYCYSAAKTWVSDSAWTDGNTFVVPSSGVGYIRILIRKDSTNSTITQGEVATQVARCSMKAVLPKGAYKQKDSVSDLNVDMETAIVSASGINTFISGTYDAPVGGKSHFTFSAISDVHGADEEFERYISYSNEHADSIDALICTGDIIPWEPTQGIPWYSAYLKRSTKPFLFVAGNHDVGQTNYSGIDQATARTNYFDPIIEAGYLSSSDFIGSGKCSWFKDFDSYKIRIIAPFEFGNCYTASSGVTNKCARRWYDTEVLEWLADALYTTPEGYSVIILTHIMSSTNMDFVDHMFCTSEEIGFPYTNWSNLFMNTIDGNPLEDLVNAFMNSTAISQTYNSAAWTELGKTATVSKDFSTRSENGKFIAYFAGHIHGNYIFRSNTYPDQMCLVMPTASGNQFQRRYGDMMYSANCRNRDNFCVVGIDTENKMINLVKIGGQVTMDMRERTYASISYAPQG